LSQSFVSAAVKLFLKSCLHCFMLLQPSVGLFFILINLRTVVWVSPCKGLEVGGSDSFQLYNIFAILLPANLPVAHEDCKLKPPVTPSMLRISPAKNKFGHILDCMVFGSTAPRCTPPAVTNSSPERRAIRCRVSLPLRRSTMFFRSCLESSAAFFCMEIFASSRIVFANRSEKNSPKILWICFAPFSWNFSWSTLSHC